MINIDEQDPNQQELKNQNINHQNLKLMKRSIKIKNKKNIILQKKKKIDIDEAQQDQQKMI